MRNHLPPARRPVPFRRFTPIPAVTLAAWPALAAAACAGTASDGNSFSASDAGATPTLVGDDGPVLEEASGASVWPGSDASSTAPLPEASDALSPPPQDAGQPFDSSWGPAPDGGCVAPLGPGTLAIDELMIESVAGSGDYGEWIEVQSTSDCAVNLNGLHGECPVGMKRHTFDVTSDVWLLAGGTFLVADSDDPVIDHDLPGPLLTWAGQPGDVLRNLGGTVTLEIGGALVDTVTFPSLKPKVGATVAFPSDCPPSRRSDWSAWQTSTASWFPGFFGTPNAPNDDVSCP